MDGCVLSLLGRGILVYTDGSRKNCARLVILVSAEMFQSVDFLGRKILICSESRSVLSAISSVKISAALVRDCKIALNKLADLVPLTLVWVPGHSGICRRVGS